MYFSTKLQQQAPTIVHFFEQVLKKASIANAYLFSGGGTDHSHKYLVIRELAQILNCEDNQHRDSEAYLPACGKCLNCRWLSESQHPQIIISLSPDLELSKRGVILMSQVTGLLQTLQVNSPFHRFVLIDPASRDCLKEDCANVLLKPIEEAFDRLCFVLLSEDYSQVLPTIVSRCQLLNFPSQNPSNPEELSTQKSTLQELLKLLQNKAQNNTPDFFALSQFVLQHASEPSFLEDLYQHYSESYCQGADALGYHKLQILDRSKKRLQSFCNARSVLEEMLFELALL